jgi:hypothetical protein
MRILFSFGDILAAQTIRLPNVVISSKTVERMAQEMIRPVLHGHHAFAGRTLK